MCSTAYGKKRYVYFNQKVLIAQKMTQPMGDVVLA